MKLIRRTLLWSLLFLFLLAAVDQLLTRVPLTVPVLQPVQTFYVDFRQRLFALVFGDAGPEATIEGVIGQGGTDRATGPAAEPTGAAPLRYLYVDRQGQLQFADSLQDVPREFRSQAKPLSP